MGGPPKWTMENIERRIAYARRNEAYRARCIAICERWNNAPTLDWSPAIATALVADYRYLEVYCNGCRQVKPVDLEALDVHPNACVTSLLLWLRCRQCGGGPTPQLIGLTRFPYRIEPRSTLSAG